MAENFSSVGENGKNPLKSFTAALKNLKPINMTFKDKPIFEPTWVKIKCRKNQVSGLKEISIHLIYV